MTLAGGSRDLPGLESFYSILPPLQPSGPDAVQYLAHLLLGDGAVEFGAGRLAVNVEFQQAPDYPVDDLVIRAARPEEAEPSLELALGVRRSPNLVRSNASTQKLIREFIRAVINGPADGLESRLEVWPESHWPGFALRQAEVFQSYTASQGMQYVSGTHCYIDHRR